MAIQSPIHASYAIIEIVGKPLRADRGWLCICMTLVCLATNQAREIALDRRIITSKLCIGQTYDETDSEILNF